MPWYCKYLPYVLTFFYFIARPDKVFSLSDTSKYLINIQKLSVEDGMASREVICGIQDSRGFIWLGTRNGLNRYDGKHFKLFTLQNGMQVQKVIEMAEDGAGFIWLLYGNMNYGKTAVSKVDLMDVKTNKFISFNKKFTKAPFKEEDIVWLKSNGKGEILFWIKSGEYYFYNAQKGFEKIITNSSNRSVNLLPQFDAIYERSGLLIGNDLLYSILDKSGIWASRSKNHTCKPLYYSGNDQWLVLYSERADKRVILNAVSKGGIKEVKEPLIYNDWLSTDNKTYTFYDAKTNSSVIYCLGKGVFLFNRQFTVLEKEEEKLIDKGKAGSLGINYYFSDRKGRIWLCTTNGVKIYEIKRVLFTPFFKESEAKNEKYVNNQARGIITDKAGNLYCNIWNNIKVWEKSSLTYSIFSAQKEINYPILFIDDYLVSCNSKINLFDIKTRKLIRSINPETFDSSNIHPDIWSVLLLDNNRLLFGTNSGFQIADIKSGIVIKSNCQSHFPPPQLVYQLFKSNKKIYAVSSNGLYVVDNNGCISEHFSNSNTDKKYKLPFDDLLHIYEDEDKNFWLATNGNGLYKWNRKDNAFKQYSIADGLSSNILYRIEKDEYGYFWISSDNGLMRFNPKDATVNTYSTKDGISNAEFNRISSFKAPDGRIFFGCLDGVISFYPKDFSYENEIFSAPLQITSFSQFYSKEDRLIESTAELLSQNKIILEPGDKFFNLEFALLDYEEGNHRYAYKIEGIEKDWNYINENSLRISGLPYGKFKLIIKGQNRYGQWSMNEIVIPLTVLKPFYIKTGFIVLVVIFFLLSITSIIILRTSKLEKDKVKLESIVEKRTSELQQSLEERNVLLKEIHHRVKNNLQVISSLFDLQSATITNDYAKKILQEGQGRVKSIALLHQQLYQQEDFRGVNLDKFINDIYRQVLEVFKKSEITIKFKITSPEILIDMDTAIPLGLIINELFTNAFKYALYNQPFPALSLNVQKSDDKFVLTYKDNGPGLPVGFDWQNSRSLGLRIIKQLSKQIGGKMEYSYENGSRFDIYFKDNTP